MKKGIEPAFPAIHENHDGSIQHIIGMTKREYFAAMAMQGMLSASADRGEVYVAERSIAFADELLRQLS